MLSLLVGFSHPMIKTVAAFALLDQVAAASFSEVDHVGKVEFIVNAECSVQSCLEPAQSDVTSLSS